MPKKVIEDKAIKIPFLLDSFSVHFPTKRVPTRNPMKIMLLIDVIRFLLEEEKKNEKND